jgi:diguanylate cyclase (GGDEF)-like protein
VLKQERRDENTTLNNPSDLTIIQAEPIEAAPISHRNANLIVLAGWELGRTIEVHGHGQILGRSPLAHTFVSAPSVSRNHARIDRVVEEGLEQFIITDLNSSNGTAVNQTRITTARLENGDKISMGDVVFRFVLEDDIDSQFHQQVHRLIHYDQLTGLLTMEAFKQRIENELRQTKRRMVCTLAMTDMDGLKRVNDNHGHLAGRMVVREMGVMMRQALREQDIAGLYGGDEAIILFPSATVAEAAEVAERLRQIVEERVFTHKGANFQVTISQGLAEWPRQGRSIEDLIAAADRALYAAKAAGRNCVRAAED